MAVIRVITLGELCIERDGAALAELPSQPVRSAVLVYLALERSATRSELTSLLWPDRDSERGRHALSQTLYELRRQLGPDWLEVKGERLQLASHITVDATVFEEHTASGRNVEALDLYEGTLLHGWRPAVTAEFDSWLDRRRAHFERLHRELCRRLIDRHVVAGLPESALVVARRWVAADPLDDEAQHRLIHLLAETGLISDALRQYADYEALIRRELDVEPLEQTRELIEHLRESGEARLPLPTSVSIGLGEEPASTQGMSPSPPQVTRRWLLRPAAFTALGLLALLAAVWLRDDARPVVDDASIAVLPFLNLSADPEQEYFSDGLTEDILTSLSRIEGLRVISRTSVWRYKDHPEPLAHIARELGVRYVLEGSVRRDGQAVRVTAQLIDATTDGHLWAETYDRQLPGVFALKTEIAERVAAELRHRLSARERERITSAVPHSPLAYDLFLRGREYLNRPGDADERKFAPAMSFFRRAVAADPRFAPAYVGLAESFRRNVYIAPHVAADSALVYARRATALDPHLPEAAAALGAALVHRGLTEQAKQAFTRALELDRNQADAMSGLAHLAALDGRLDEAIRWERRALVVDPFAATRLTTLGSYYFDIGALNEAAGAFEMATELAPDFPEPTFLLAQILLIRGEDERADRRMLGLLDTASDHPATRLLLARYEAQRGRPSAAMQHLDNAPRLGAANLVRAHVDLMEGRSEAALSALERMRDGLQQMQAAGVAPPPRLQFYLATLLHDQETGVAVLGEHWRSGLRVHTPDPPEVGVYWIDQEPFVAGLREDPRFRALLGQIRAELDGLRSGLERESETVGAHF